MEYLFIYKCLYVAIIYVHFVEVNKAIVEINYGHQKIGFYNNEGNLSKDQYWLNNCVSNKDILFSIHKIEKKFYWKNIYVYHYLYEHIIIQRTQSH